MTTHQRAWRHNLPDYSEEDYTFLEAANKYFNHLLGPDYWDYKFDAKGNVCQMVPLSEKNKDGDGDTQYRTVEFE